MWHNKILLYILKLRSVIVNHMYPAPSFCPHISPLQVLYFCPYFLPLNPPCHLLLIGPPEITVSSPIGFLGHALHQKCPVTLTYFYYLPDPGAALQTQSNIID